MSRRVVNVHVACKPKPTATLKHLKIAFALGVADFGQDQLVLRRALDRHPAVPRPAHSSTGGWEGGTSTEQRCVSFVPRIARVRDSFTRLAASWRDLKFRKRPKTLALLICGEGWHAPRAGLSFGSLLRCDEHCMTAIPDRGLTADCAKRLHIRRQMRAVCLCRFTRRMFSTE